MKRLLLGAVLLLTAAVVLSLKPKTSATLTVSVASNFRPTAEKLATLFEAETGQAIRLSAASTGKLTAQISNGAPFDLFLSADRQSPLSLEKSGEAIPSTRFTYALGRLAVWAPQRAPVTDSIAFLKTLTAAEIAIANPELAPYGRAAMETLETLSIVEAESNHFVRGENIAQTFHFVSSGGIPAGVVAFSQLVEQGLADTDGSPLLIPASFHSPIEQQATLIRESKAGRRFLDFLKSEAAAAIIAADGYDLPR